MKFRTFWICVAIAISAAGWTLVHFGISPWTLLAALIVLACPVAVGGYALWQARQTRLDLEKGIGAGRNTPP